MEQWLEIRNKYLHILLEMEGRPSIPKCSLCNRHGDIKCPDCFGVPLFCKGCCVKAHRCSPFHHPPQQAPTPHPPLSLSPLFFFFFFLEPFLYWDSKLVQDRL